MGNMPTRLVVPDWFTISQGRWLETALFTAIFVQRQLRNAGRLVRLVWQSLGETLPAHIRRTYNGTAEPSAGLRRECKLPIWRELHLGGPQSLIQFISFTH